MTTDLQSVAKSVLGIDTAFLTSSQLKELQAQQRERQRRVEAKADKIMADKSYMVDYLVELGFKMESATELFKQVRAKALESADKEVS